MQEIELHVEDKKLRSKCWGNFYKLLVDAYFERFVIAVSASLPGVNNFNKEIYLKRDPLGLILN
jgi:hypothetical protein